MACVVQAFHTLLRAAAWLLALLQLHLTGKYVTEIILTTAFMGKLIDVGDELLAHLLKILTSCLAAWRSRARATG